MFLSGWLKFSVTLQDFFFFSSPLSLADSFALVTLSLDNEKNKIGNAHPDHNMEQDVVGVCRETACYESRSLVDQAVLVKLSTQD